MHENLLVLRRYVGIYIVAFSVLLTISVIVLVHFFFTDPLMTITIGLAVCYLSVCSVLFSHTRFDSHWQRLSEHIISQRESTAHIKGYSEDGAEQYANIEAVFGVFNQLPTPVAVFSDTNQLVFFNFAMHRQLNVPLCVGLSAKDCGFEFSNGSVCHASFTKEWKLESYMLAAGRYSLLTANFILEQLQNEKRHSQQNMIRILSHELNNSLTPISSISDTLLTSHSTSEHELQGGLMRIKARSERLLEFVKRYSQLNQIPPPEFEYFDLQQMIMLNANELGVKPLYQGDHQLFADPMLMEQVIINLLKNAKEASGVGCKIVLTNNKVNNWQLVRVENEGNGFANLENALTPLYTTKKNGQGLGLTLCNDIVEAHRGQMKLFNTEVGACVELRFPFN